MLSRLSSMLVVAFLLVLPTLAKDKNKAVTPAYV